MTYKVALRKNDTGEIRFSEIEWDWFENGKGGDYFWWTEGNYSCDCNRWSLFERASGLEPDIEEAKCSEGRFSALYAELPDGTKIDLDSDDSAEGQSK